MSSNTGFFNPQVKASQEMQQLQQLFATSSSKDTGIYPANQNLNRMVTPQPQNQLPLPNANFNRLQKNSSLIEPNLSFSPSEKMESSAFTNKSILPVSSSEPFSLTQELSDLKEFLMDAPGLDSNSSSFSINQPNRLLDPPENTRLILYLEQPQGNYIFNQNDILLILRNFSPPKSIKIFEERPAAEATMTSRSAANEAKKELDKIHLPQIGLLRCNILSNDQSVYSLVPSHYIGSSPSHRLSMDYTNKSNEMDKKDLYSSTHFDNLDTIQMQKSHMPQKSPNGPTHPKKKIGWLELIDVFSFEPQFDITDHILGPNKTHINFILECTNEKIGLNIQGKPVDSAPFDERLHLVIFSSDSEAYFKAIQLVQKLLLYIMDELRKFAKMNNLTLPQTAGFCRHEYEDDAEGNHNYLGVLYDSRNSTEHSPPHSPPYQLSSRRSRSPQYKRRVLSNTQREGRDRRHEPYGTSAGSSNTKSINSRTSSPHNKSSPQRHAHVGGGRRIGEPTQPMKFHYNRGTSGMH